METPPLLRSDAAAGVLEGDGWLESRTGRPE